MSEFSKYGEMRDRKLSAFNAYSECRSDGFNQLDGIRMLREIYGLSLIDAKKISFEADTGHPADRPQPGLEQQFTDVLDDLLGD
jgi:hypothetical protein